MKLSSQIKKMELEIDKLEATIKLIEDGTMLGDVRTYQPKLFKLKKKYEDLVQVLSGWK